MTIPTKMILTPTATTTVAEGESTDASSEFWQRVNSPTVTAGVFVVYENVPYAVAQQVLQSPDPDTAIKTQIACCYPSRVASV
jgi:hypothetical protein